MKGIIVALIAVLLAAVPVSAAGETPSVVAARRGGQPSPSRGGASDRATASRRLAEAQGLLRKGKSTAAAGVLEVIVNGPAVAGVTDEALFRLALLSLRPGERAPQGLGDRLLRRLKKEYPGSQWTAQAEPLVELLKENDELRSQNRSLKSATHSLTTERDELKKKVGELEGKIQQLNTSLEQLKHLDLELEQKTR